MPRRHQSCADSRPKSPVRNNPIVTVDDGIQLQLNLNTDELGRTFQDRTHVFEIWPRPGAWRTSRDTELGNALLLLSPIDGVQDNENIYNWNMLGKRGNIVQTYPAVEYDFTPRHLRVNANDLIHIQWTGTDGGLASEFVGMNLI